MQVSGNIALMIPRLVILIVLALSLGGPSSVYASSNAVHAAEAGAEKPDGRAGKELAATGIAGEGDNAASANRSDYEAKNKKATYIVVLKDKSLAHYSGGVAGYEATSIQAVNAKSPKNKAIDRKKLNARSLESVSYLSYLADRRAVAIQSVRNSIDRDLDISFEYAATFVGFAAEMTAEEAQRVAALNQVAFVELEKTSYLHTDAGPVWSGAAGVWGGDGSALSYKSTLSGANEVPPVSSTVSGTGEFTYNFHTGVLSYTIKVENPNNLQLGGMHIHKAATGSNGAVVHDLNISPTTFGVFKQGSVTLSDDDEAALVNGMLYVNVHSVVNPGGEVRGQITFNGTLGEGIIVGIIDTGIDPWNPSFLGTGGDGYVHANPHGAGNYLGVCNPASDIYDASFPCNEKLIGAWGYRSPAYDPRDSRGHGSHTGSIAVGNIVFDAVVDAPTKVFTADISGVAPHANIIAYAACPTGTCSGDALAKARDQALLDGVDVINYSIGASSPTSNPWGSTEAIQWLALRDAGVFVATSNGNSGNGAATTGSPADLPWVTSVGASSHNRSFLVTLTVFDSTNASITVSGQAVTNGYGPAELVFSNSITDTENTRLCAPGAFAPGTFKGEIVICERGKYPRVDKGQSVLYGGAGGYVLAESVEGNGGPGAVAADTHVLPAAHIDYHEYQNLRQFMLSDSIGTVTGVLSGARLDLDYTHGDIMATFSSRGPNRTDADLIVPSVTAPGRAILAAYHQADTGDGDYTYNVIQGTSMSGPHVAGAAALLSVLHPDWTPAEMQSAMMMTARDTVLDDDGMTVATPFAQGSGHINVSVAAKSPMIMNVTNAEYEGADPELMNDFGIRDLNIASLGDDSCAAFCRWTRRVENAADETLTWSASFDGPDSFVASFSPSEFTLAPGESQEIEIELNVTATDSDGEWHFGSFEFDETSGNYPDTHWPSAVVATSSNIPEVLDIETRTTTGSVDMVDLVSADISDFYTEVTGLTQAPRHDFTLVEVNDTTADFPDIFFEDSSNTHFVQIIVSDDSFSVIADIVETTSQDLDMLLFLDADGNGPDLADVGDPAENPYACQSANPGSAEFCEILSPSEGTYYVAIINFSQSTVGGDPVDLATAVIPDNGLDEGNLTAIGPVTVSAGSPYSITVSYDEPDMIAIDRLYGYFTIGSDPDNAGDIATVRVGIEYLGTPDIEIDPSSLTATVKQDVGLTQTLTLSTSGGVLDWDVLTPEGDQVVQDGSFEEGYSTNPYWRAGASNFDSQLPICSPATCAPRATDGDWFLWLGSTGVLSAYAEQDITISSGNYASLTFRMLMEASSSLTATLTVTIDGAPIAVFTEADLDSFESFTLVNLDVSAYADGQSHLLRFDFENPTKQNFSIFIDEVSVVSGIAGTLCKGIEIINWLGVSPSSGSLSPGQMDLVVSYDASGLAPGIYTDSFCVTSNDPDEPLLHVPVTMTVEPGNNIFSDGFED